MRLQLQQHPAMKVFVRAAALALTAFSVQPLEAGYFEMPRGPFDTVQVGLVILSPYEGSPYTRWGEMSFELRTETEVDPYKPADEQPPTLAFKGKCGFPTPAASLSPPDWGASFGVLRSLEPREFCFLRSRRDRADLLFNEQAAAISIRNSMNADARWKADLREKALWDRAQRRVAGALKKANADKAMKRKVLGALKKAHLEVSKQKAQLRAEIERLEQEAEGDY